MRVNLALTVVRRRQNSLLLKNVHEPHRPQNDYRCPRCHLKILHERRGFSICPVRFWEDEGEDDHDAEEVRDGPNGSWRLMQARANFL